MGKQAFAVRAFAGAAFAPGAFRGTGVAPPPPATHGPLSVAGLQAFTPGAVAARTFVPGAPGLQSYPRGGQS